MQEKEDLTSLNYDTSRLKQAGSRTNYADNAAQKDDG